MIEEYTSENMNLPTQKQQLISIDYFLGTEHYNKQFPRVIDI